MLNRPAETFIGCDASYGEATIVLYGAPFDGTTSFRPGTRFGSKAIRGESYGLETYSPLQNRDLNDLAVFDSGDLELPIGDARLALNQIRGRARQILGDGKLPFLLGGEHLVTLGAVEACHEAYPDLTMIHFDAHADLRDDYLGVRLSHACVLRRCWDLLGDGRIWQFGIRSGDRLEFAWADQGHVRMRRFDFAGLDGCLENLSGKPVYLTVDLDVLDPSVFPGTGTPEAGGVRFLDLQAALLQVAGGCRLVGCDVVELSPMLDASGISTATAGKIVRELLLAIGGQTG